MSNALTLPSTFGANNAIARYNGQPTDDTLGAGVSSGYGVIGYRGKVWSIRRGGEEKQLMRDDGDGPRGSIEVVVVKASPAISKVFYQGGWQEGSSAAPDCFSNNGVTPDVNSTNKQSSACATCPRNAWVTRPDGKKGKQCADSKRLAVAPINDLNSDPMLLRVPAASLGAMKNFGQQMSGYGYPGYWTYATRVSFDTQESYPKFVFGAIRPLTDAELDTVDRWRDSHEVQRILAEDEHSTPQVTGGSPFEVPAQSTPQTQRPMTGAASTKSAPTVAPASAAPTPTAPPASESHSGKTSRAGSVATASVAGTATSPSTSDNEPEAMGAPTGIKSFDDEISSLIGD